MKLHRVMKENGVRVIDGSIIGGPAWKPGEAVLYLSGEGAEIIKECFQSGPLETEIIGEEVGRASALKMCYAAYSKGTTALLLSILATAEALGVRADLYRQWEMDDPGFSEQVNRRVVRATGKAWRFAGEMEEISATFEAAGLPGGFHQAAAKVYRRIVDAEPGRLERVDQVLAALLHKTDIS
jgi:3-hydroxyisobutyrate dehydrogenase-like beta-hydroxyacid dehydrogenase